MTNLHDFQFFTVETMVIQAIILALILYVLNKFIFKPYLVYLDQETEKRRMIEDIYNNIEDLNKKALEKQEDILSEARKKANTLLQKSEDIAKEEALMIKQKAETEAINIKSVALANIKEEKENMIKDLKFRSIDLILKFNAKLFNNEKVSKDFVEKELSSF